MPAYDEDEAYPIEIVEFLDGLHSRFELEGGLQFEEFVCEMFGQSGILHSSNC